MPMSVVGLSHQTAPLEIRERVALGPSDVEGLLRRLRPILPETVILSTCNRTELYTFLQKPGDAESLFQEAFSGTAHLCRSYLFSYEDEAVARHLFRVAAGLESLVFGEAEILGQVRRAWEVAHAAGVTGTVTSRLFQQSLAVGKRVRSQTDIGRFSASVSSASVVLARRVFGDDLSARTVLIVGAGEVGEGVARCLYKHGVKQMMVTNHHDQRAQQFASRHGAVAVPWPASPSILAKSDIVISSTGAQGTVFGLHEMQAAMALRESRPLHLIDLAMPRDVDPQVAQLPGVHLHNIDDIQAVVDGAVHQRQQTQPQVEAIVTEAVVGFEKWLHERQAANSIKMLRTKGESIRLAEMEWALPKLSNLSSKERTIVDQLTSRLVKKLLHHPTIRLRQTAADNHDKGYLRMAHELFDLGDTASEPVTGGDAFRNDKERGE